jgi:uncharacterized membrane protein AbrB (regulator of aidB expression)
MRTKNISQKIPKVTMYFLIIVSAMGIILSGLYHQRSALLFAMLLLIPAIYIGQKNKHESPKWVKIIIFLLFTIMVVATLFFWIILPYL